MRWCQKRGPESTRECLKAALQCKCGVAALPTAEQRQVTTHCNVAPAIVASRQHHVPQSFQCRTRRLSAGDELGWQRLSRGSISSQRLLKRATRCSTTALNNAGPHDMQSLTSRARLIPGSHEPQRQRRPSPGLGLVRMPRCMAMLVWQCQYPVVRRPALFLMNTAVGNCRLLSAAPQCTCQATV
jgi:hypothetical protein